MVLLFTILDSKGSIESFWFRPNSLESGFDVINYACSLDDQLLCVHLIDEENVTELPITAFDGVSFSRHIQRLAQVWETILLAPVLKQPSVRGRLLANPKLLQERINHILHQADLSNARSASLAVMVHRLEVLQQRAAMSTSPNTSLIMHYQTQIMVFETQMARSTAYYNQLALRLNKLLEI